LKPSRLNVESGPHKCNTTTIRLGAYSNVTQKFGCIAAVRTSAVQLQYKFFYNCCK